MLIVVRGYDYRGDLAALRPYITEYRPLLMGVDGGADALIEAGYKPDMIIGDMDSCSDETLRCGAELVVHAYHDGRAPGLERIEKLGCRRLCSQHSAPARTLPCCSLTPRSQLDRRCGHPCLAGGVPGQRSSWDGLHVPDPASRRPQAG